MKKVHWMINFQCMCFTQSLYDESFWVKMVLNLHNLVILLTSYWNLCRIHDLYMSDIRHVRFWGAMDQFSCLFNRLVDLIIGMPLDYGYINICSNVPPCRLSNSYHKTILATSILWTNTISLCLISLMMRWRRVYHHIYIYNNWNQSYSEFMSSYM